MKNTLRNWMLLQAAVILLTALWALLDIRSFMFVTGPKTDIWLVKTVAVMGLCSGGTLLISALNNSLYPAITWLALSISAGFATLDIYYYLKDVIAWTYMIDAGLQIIFLTGYAVLLRKRIN